jgi:hypothetical protein
MQHPFCARTLANAAIVALSFLCASCLLQDESENFVQLEQQADPQYRPTLKYSYSGSAFVPITDTLWMSPSEELYLSFEGSVLYGSKIEINGNTVISESSSRHRIQGKDLTIGVNRILATQYVKSGTRSLGDIVGAEAAAYVQPLVIIVSNDPPFVPAFTSIEIKDGSLQLQWEPYKRGDFYSYEIRKYDQFVDSYAAHRDLIITDQQQTSLADNTYAGGFVPYVLRVYRGGTYYSSEIQYVDIPYEPAFRIVPLGGGRSRVSWNQPPFYKGIAAMTLTIGLTELYQGIPADQTSMEIQYDGHIGNYVYVTLAMRARVENLIIANDQVSVTEQIVIGK